MRWWGGWEEDEGEKRQEERRRGGKVLTRAREVASPSLQTDTEILSKLLSREGPLPLRFGLGASSKVNRLARFSINSTGLATWTWQQARLQEDVVWVQCRNSGQTKWVDFRAFRSRSSCFFSLARYNFLYSRLRGSVIPYVCVCVCMCVCVYVCECVCVCVYGVWNEDKHLGRFF